MDDMTTKVAKEKLEEKAKNKILVIGAGHVGGLGAVEAFAEGIDTYILNTSIRDLSDVVVDDSIPSYIVGKEGRGAGKDREKAAILFNENGRELFKEPQFINKVQMADIIFVAVACGGGSGSKLGPSVCQLLQKAFPRKITIFIGVTPKDSESPTAKNNTMQCIDEIKTLNIPYTLIDLHHYEDIDNDVVSKRIGKDIVECVKCVSAKYLESSKSQMIDENDMKTVVSQPGYMAFYHIKGITSAILEKQTIQSIMIDKIKESPCMKIQKDGIYEQMAAIVNVPEDIADDTKKGNYSELFEFLGGSPKGVFENYNVTNGTKGEFIVILSGMTMPFNRLSNYLDAVREYNEKRKAAKDISITEEVEKFKFLSENQIRDKLSSDSRSSEEEIGNALDDFFN